MPHIYSFFEHWFGRYEPVAGALLVALLLMAFAVSARRRLAAVSDVTVPDDRLTLRTFAELIVSGLKDLVEGTMGPHSRAFVPLFGVIFLYILANNLLGLIPGFNPPTSNVNTNLGVALVVFMLTHILGIRAQGFVGYAKHFMGPVIWLAVLMVPIELISNLVRPLSLSLRLYGNMFGDHAVLSIFTDLAKVVVPVLVLGLGTFVCFVQALVFTMLSMVYIAMAIEHHEDHKGEGGHHEA